MDIQAEVFLAEVLKKANDRQIATILGEMEAFTGVKDKKMSTLVKDFCNRNRRAMYRALTGTEVESPYET